MTKRAKSMISGMTIKHMVLTPSTRKHNRDALEVAIAAVRRAYREAQGAANAHADFHLVLTMDRQDITAPATTGVYPLGSGD